MTYLISILLNIALFFSITYITFILFFKKHINKNDITNLSFKLTGILVIAGFLINEKYYEISKKAYDFWLCLFDLDISLVIHLFFKIILSFPFIILIIIIYLLINNFTKKIINKDESKIPNNFFLHLFLTSFMVIFIYLTGLLALSEYSINLQIKQSRLYKEFNESNKVFEAKSKQYSSEKFNKDKAKCELDGVEYSRPKNAICTSGGKTSAWECELGYIEKDNQCWCSSGKYTCDDNSLFYTMTERKKELESKMIKNISLDRTEETIKEYNNLDYEVKQLVKDYNNLMNNTCICKQE